MKRLSFHAIVQLGHLDETTPIEVFYDMMSHDLVTGFPSTLRPVITHVIADMGGLDEDVKDLLSESEHERLEERAKLDYGDRRDEWRAMFRPEPQFDERKRRQTV